MGDIKNGGITPLNCDDAAGRDDTGCSDIRSSATDVVCRVGDGDGEDRRFLFSAATIASFIFLFFEKLLNCKIFTSLFLFNLFWFKCRTSTF